MGRSLFGGWGWLDDEEENEHPRKKKKLQEKKEQAEVLLRQDRECSVVGCSKKNSSLYFIIYNSHADLEFDGYTPKTSLCKDCHLMVSHTVDGTISAYQN